MSRIVAAFLALAVIAGLVLAFSPQVREQAENSWQEFKLVWVEFQNTLEVKFRDVLLRDEAQVNAGSELAGESDSAPQQEPVIQINWDGLMDRFRTFWAELLIRFRVSQ